MFTVNTNTTSLITQNSLANSNNLVKTSIERLSTGYRINHASDDAANMSISKNMECQISGTDVALENSQEAINLLQTADGALDIMQGNLQKIRDLTVQAMNGTYSNEEKAMLQKEINQLLEETYKQKNSTTYNKIKLFGTKEDCPCSDNATSGSDTSSVALASTVPLTGTGITGTAGSGSTATIGTTGNVGTHEVTKLTEAEAIAEGYTCIHNETEFMKIKSNTSGKYCLMSDIDFSKISGWGDVTLTGELNGNGYAVNNLTINSTTNTNMHGLFVDNTGIIKNLSMNNINIDSTNDYIGGLVGGSSGTTGTIDNCSVAGSIKGSSYVGGLVGYSYNGTITNSLSSVNVTGLDYSAGGIVGNNELGYIINCLSSGNINGVSNTGGIAGNNNGNVENCSSTATVTGTEDIGGIVGDNKGYVMTCSALGIINGSEDIGGLVGDSSGTIIASKSLGTVTGAGDNIGGLVGNNAGTIDTSYATSAVKGSYYVGGLVGYNSAVDISNSYALGSVSGERYVGGFVGQHQGGDISNSYSTGTVTGSDITGGFVGQNGSYYTAGNINNSYTTSSLNFYGSSRRGTISNCHGTKSQTGVTAHNSEWFDDGDNLTFLGAEYDTTKNPPDLIDNSRYEPGPDPPGPDPPGPDPPGPDPPGPQSTEIQFQVGANSGEKNTITVDTSFSLNDLSVDVSTLESAQKALDDVDASLKNISTKRSEIGATQNRLESITYLLVGEKCNLEASHSTIIDTDYANESSQLVKNQILQSIAASLLVHANTNPNIALTLLK